MTRERWQKIQDLFYSATDLPPASRSEYLREACQGDESLFQHIEDLIESERQAEGFLNGTLRESADELVGARPGERLGPYRIVKELGHGGMGDVYLAERDDQQFHKQVAIKLIRSDGAPQHLLARFRAERQILATLEHPNIARLLDGGTAGSSPYLVMEYVAGESIDRYCARQSLSIRERLGLFRAVCEAAAYAHRSLVIHRDIKPSNILVTAEGVPKLLDFGIAKLMKEDIEGAGLTRPLERVMTPAYSSPEVVRGERVTTAADVYSLGAMLYELLTERAPFHLTSSQAAEVERVVCKQDPPKPGTLDRRLRGDLENIILMAMQKEAARRYGSVEQLIGDIDRYLTGYPVAARSDHIYRLGKFVRRNRTALAAGVLVAAGIAGWVFSLKAEQERTRQGFAQVRELAESLLFQTDEALRPVAGAMAAREAIVKRGLKYLDGLARQGGADPRLQDELADAYERVAMIQYTANPNLGQPAGALESTRKALTLRQALLAAHPGDLRLKRKLAQTYLRLASVRWGLNDASAAMDSTRSAGAILSEVSRAMPKDPGVHIELAGVYGEEAQRHLQMANFAQAHDLAESSLQEARIALGGNPRDRNARRRVADADMVLVKALAGGAGSIAVEQREEARRLYGEADGILSQLAEELPDDSGQRLMQISLYSLACAVDGLDPREQLAACHRGAILADQIAAVDPANISARSIAIGAHHNLGGRMQAAGEEGGLAEVRRAAELADQWFSEKPDSPGARLSDAMEHQGFAGFLLRTGDLRNAVIQVRRAIALRDPVLMAAANPRIRHDQAAAYMLAGEVGLRQHDCAQALRDFQAAMSLSGDPREIDHIRRMMSPCVP